MNSLPDVVWNDGYIDNEEEIIALDVPRDCSDWVRRQLANCAKNNCSSYDEPAPRNFENKTIIYGHFSTGGWPGAEKLVSILERKTWVKGLFLSWRRGDHYIFEFSYKETPPIA